MPGLLPDVDPDGLMEYSVVYTDRAVNHMSQSFQGVMRDIHTELTSVYNAASAVVVPGSGTFGMEAVARQFTSGKKALVIRNGWFSYRWSQIFEQGSIPAEEIVLKAQPVDGDPVSPSFAPHPIEDVVATIRAEKPDMVFAPHVETSAGMILPDDYIAAVGAAAHEVGALFALDCIASGTVWVDMQALGVDILCSAPQKGWSGPPCAGLVMLSEQAVERMGQTQSTSVSCDLAKWHSIMGAYLNGGHAYHATMPTDALRAFRDVVMETKAFGYSEAKMAQQVLGSRVRSLLTERGFKSVAAEGFGAPGVTVSYTSDPNIKNGSAFAAQGLQVAAGVPLQVDEPEGFSTFRLGLFGLDKLKNLDRTVETLGTALDAITAV
jgi:aspartate aminotransferase-like enzyme